MSVPPANAGKKPNNLKSCNCGLIGGRHEQTCPLFSGKKIGTGPSIPKSQVNNVPVKKETPIKTIKAASRLMSYTNNQNSKQSVNKQIVAAQRQDLLPKSSPTKFPTPVGAASIVKKGLGTEKKTLTPAVLPTLVKPTLKESPLVKNEPVNKQVPTTDKQSTTNNNLENSKASDNCVPGCNLTTDTQQPAANNIVNLEFPETSKTSKELAGNCVVGCKTMACHPPESTGLSDLCTVENAVTVVTPLVNKEESAIVSESFLKAPNCITAAIMNVAYNPEEVSEGSNASSYGIETEIPEISPLDEVIPPENTESSVNSTVFNPNCDGKSSCYRANEVKNIDQCFKEEKKFDLGNELFVHSDLKSQISETSRDKGNSSGNNIENEKSSSIEEGGSSAFVVVDANLFDATVLQGPSLPSSNILEETQIKDDSFDQMLNDVNTDIVKSHQSIAFEITSEDSKGTNFDYVGKIPSEPEKTKCVSSTAPSTSNEPEVQCDPPCHCLERGETCKHKAAKSIKVPAHLLDNDPLVGAVDPADVPLVMTGLACLCVVAQFTKNRLEDGADETED